MSVVRPTMLLLGVSLCLACAPTVETMHPVTLQHAVRQPSLIPDAEPGTRSADAPDSDPGAGETAQAGDTRNAAAPPKRQVLEGSLTVEEEPSLSEIAKRERQRRRQAPPPMVRIDDRNIERRAETLGNTSPEPPPARPQPTDAADGESTTDVPGNRDLSDAETYWRERVLSLRYQWRDLADRRRELEAEVNGLRRDFYQEDDPYYRDSEIKPEWDRAWQELQQTEREIQQLVEELDGTIEDGRRAGALPGWLREGIELEPEAPEDSEDDTLGTTEPVEPRQTNRAAEIDS